MYQSLLPLLRAAICWAPAADGSDEINWLLEAPWAKVSLLVVVAVGVMYMANKRAKGKRGRSALAKPDFDLRVSRLESLPVTPIADARSGDIHLGGVLIKGEGALGTGPQACVYQNRARSSRATAIAAELIFLQDETGMIGIEDLESARVIAPKQEQGAHDIIGLYLGDRVEVVGELMVFESPQTVDGKPLHGMLGSLGQIQVRVVERPEPAASEDSPSEDSPLEAPASTES